MKKLFAIAFTCVYLTLTVGVVHATHYCMGRVNSSAFFSFESDKCVCDLFATQSAKSCCDDEVTLVKIDNDQSLSSALTLNPEFFTLWENDFFLAEENASDGEYNFYTSRDKPPGWDVPLFVQHCSLILYGDSDLA